MGRTPRGTEVLEVSRRMNSQRALLGLGAVLLATLAGWWWVNNKPSLPSPEAVARPKIWPDLPHVVTVEVLNATAVPGLARVGTAELRLAGLDVKYYGSADSVQRKDLATRVLIRGSDTTGVGRVREVMGTIRIESAPAPDRLVDLTIVLGSDYHGPRNAP